MLEVLASALLVAILSVGVLKTFDAANAATGNTRARAIAADLAQQDQERMRAFRAKELSNLNATYTRTVAGGNYTITSTAIWVNDGSGSRRCGLTSGRADYLRIKSSVVWDRMRGAAPVTSTSLYAPPSGSFGDEGNLGFEILNRSAAGVPGATVSLSGPATRTAVTDSAGCVFFAFLPQGNYTATISKAGYVDYNGNATITKTYGVTGGTTQVQPLDYDQAGTLNVTVQSRKLSATDVNAQAGHVSVGHSQINSPNYRIFGTGVLLGSFGATQGLNTLFPFTSNYSVYTGNCAANKPTGWTAPVPPAPTVTPGGVTSVTVNEPGLQISAAALGTASGTPSVAIPQGTDVRLTPRSPGCSGVLNLEIDGSGWVSPTNVATSPDPGVPFGAYDICVRLNSRAQIRTSVDVDQRNGETVVVPNINSGTPSTSTCP